MSPSPSSLSSGDSARASGAKPYYQQDGVTLHLGDARSIPLPDESVQTCVTSPPYFGLRDYGVDGQIGMEETPAEFIDSMVAVFREVHRVLKEDGTLWLNLGDSYNAYNGNRGAAAGENKNHHEIMPALPGGYGLTCKTLKPKDLIGIPWRVALALQADGWYLRSDIIWHKPNPMPESVTDRPTRAHEYIFLLSKSDRYYYDHEAIKVDGSGVSGGASFGKVNLDAPNARRISSEDNARIRGTDKQRGHSRRHAGFNDRWDAMERAEQVSGKVNRRDVWTVCPANYPGAHFATYPPALVEPCILAGSRPGDIVLDPFNGSGTTGAVAQKWGRQYVGVDLNPEYLKLSKSRFAQGVLFTPQLAQEVPQ